ncbi:MAG: biopolymer transporter ExbD [Polyangiaceae bacterium]|nr:biopolymer transporter ExbD [Polyangiaceae bacterium]
MASIQSSAGSRRGGIVGINVTPLVDVVLVLLIIMMVSATYIVSQSLKIELPKTATSDSTVSSPDVVTIAEDGALKYGEHPITLAALTEKLRASYRAHGKDTSVVVSADKGARHGSVIEVIDAAKLVGITKFAINVDKSKAR